MAKQIYEVIELLNKQKTKVDKIKVLKENESWALKDFIRGVMDSTIEFLLPKGAPPPYTAAEEHNCPSSFLRENKKLAYFVKGSPKAENLPALKRESVFIGMLESINPNDAQLMVEMINKKVPKGLTRPIVEEAFPGLLRD